jgi:16S rRNA (cytosine1402-N4)-methyltransferase
MSAFHTPVLLKQSIDGLKVQAGGTYIDATFGGGGHSHEILNRIGSGKLYAFDQDEEAIRNVLQDNRFELIHHNFRFLQNFMQYYQVPAVDGILADLGVSSHDFDEAVRGFSFRFDTFLDMRMNQKSLQTAEKVLNEYKEEQLCELFREYGELNNAPRLAKLIINARQKEKITTSRQLLDAIRTCIPKAIEKKYLAQVFQALRIEVNDEMGALREFLLASLKLLKAGGRLSVITYHSLEDRLVKNFIRSGNLDGKIEQDFFGNFRTPFLMVNHKVIVPDAQELLANPRSRSAKLRIAEKRAEI